ncbi:GAF and ANTAR domain-containing protein [Amycolatopsis aidingensis]|uniref:GAF and ANTAR domain-containing protein n=1 Tax=Amycolatopsis aidingensis TaxID=2842453 RepID=UPI001C0CFFE5|nr:GAF and ANTAR domain-containing protein [Amycolatopsis aidingensis]
MKGDRGVYRAFVEVADTVRGDFDLIEFLDTVVHRSAELLDIADCGLLLEDESGEPSLIAASTERVRQLGLLQLRKGTGPCLDCLHSGRRVQHTDLAAGTAGWPEFTPEALASGFLTVYAVPLRHRQHTIGAMNAFSPAPLSGDSLDLWQSLADVATIGLVHERAVRHGAAVNRQLQEALNSRVLIEQAKGALAERMSIPVDDAFAVLRGNARRNRRTVRELAVRVLDGRALPDGDPPAGPGGP